MKKLFLIIASLGLVGCSTPAMHAPLVEHTTPFLEDLAPVQMVENEEIEKIEELAQEIKEDDRLDTAEPEIILYKLNEDAPTAKVHTTSSSCGKTELFICEKIHLKNKICMVMLPRIIFEDIYQTGTFRINSGKHGCHRGITMGYGKYQFYLKDGTKVSMRGRFFLGYLDKKIVLKSANFFMSAKVKLSRFRGTVRVVDKARNVETRITFLNQRIFGNVMVTDHKKMTKVNHVYNKSGTFDHSYGLDY